MRHFTLLLSLLWCFETIAQETDQSKPWTFWYWMNGAVSKEGITHDLEAMSEVGLGGCYLMPIYGIDQAPELGGTIRQGTPEWWQMVNYALQEADRLGLKIGMHICDGFALAGGPWITPGQSMRIVSSTDTILHIGKQGLDFNANLLPNASNDDFRDIASYAIPLRYQPKNTTLQPHIESSCPDFTIDKKGRIKCKEACTFTYTYDLPITISALEITTYNNSLQALRMRVSYLPEDQETKLPDGSYRDLPPHEKGQGVVLANLTPPRHGWQNYDQPTTVALPTVTTRRLIFEWSPEGTEKGAEDLDNGKWSKTLKIQEMKVLSTPRIDDWEGKSGRVWRVSSANQNTTTPEMYIPKEEIVRLSSGTHLAQGDWRIFRIGHTSTLHENATGGDCKGLECDKFSHSAITSQLNHWFGEAFRQCDSTLTRRVLQYMHIDSWECASQNWSDSIAVSRNGESKLQTATFAEYFAQQRGYDLLPYLPLLVGIPIQDNETSERILRDVRTTIAQLVNEAFYPILANKARELGCKLSAESVAPTMVSDGMEHYRQVDYPMGEFWLNSPTHDKPNDMLDAISGGHVYGKQIIQAEGFTELRGIFDETPARLKGLLDKQFCIGMNRLFFHVFTHNPDPSKKPGMTLNGIGLFFQPTQPWWHEARSFVDYISRCQEYLQQGRPVVDLAVYTGHEIPRRAILPDRLPDWKGYHYDSFNYDALIHPNQDSPFTPKYKVLILPGARKMDPDYQPLPEDAKQAIAKFRDSGVKIIEGTPNADELNEMGVFPDVIAPDNILFAHRTMLKDSADLYFLSNQSDQPCTFEASFRSNSNLNKIINPIDGTCKIFAHRFSLKSPSYQTGTISLPAYGSCIIMADPMMPMTNTDFKDKTEARRDYASNDNYIKITPTTPYRLFFEENGIMLSSDTLPDWSQMQNDSIRYYSGRVRYSFDFKFKSPKRHKDRTILKFNKLYDTATIMLNGVPCGSVWTSPYELDVTNAIKNGKNHIDIWVANSWNNAILGHDTGHDPFGNIWTNAKYRNPNPTLLPAGLGSVYIITRENLDL